MSVARPFRGIALITGAVFLFACMDVTTKLLVAEYPAPVVVAVRYIVQCLLMVVLLMPRGGRQMLHTRRTALVWVRAACLAATSLVVALAFRRLPVAEATAIVYLSPLLVVMVGGLVLRESIGRVGVLAAIAGFVGVLLIARPGSGLDPLGVALALAGALMIAGYQLLSRVLAATESTLALLFYAALFGSILYGLMVPWFLEGLAPTMLQLGLFSSLGVTGGLGHYLFTAAHRYAPASSLAPVMYVQLLWASLLGGWVFGDVPDGLSLLGMGVIALSGVAVVIKSRWTRRTVVAAAPE
ncbi:MAG: EamA family transporter [Polycyclovorans sp.]|jgi:drug/metabolite transporter (DMT)-like permease|nr:EamA family transporter [Polycyclovorans sp.]|tara:strand:+ start:1035 stop:1928 length:894 start_codon:yes stop_codon:yes gene_type:complete